MIQIITTSTVILSFWWTRSQQGHPLIWMIVFWNTTVTLLWLFHWRKKLTYEKNRDRERAHHDDAQLKIGKNTHSERLLPSPQGVHLWDLHQHRIGWCVVGVLLTFTLQTVQVALFTCVFDVILVTHKRMMTIPTPTCAPPRYDTIPVLLCVYAVSVLLEIWWWCVSNFPETGSGVRVWVYDKVSVLLVSCSVMCCQDGCFMVRQKRIAKEYLSHNLDKHCLDDLMSFLSFYDLRWPQVGVLTVLVSIFPCLCPGFLFFFHKFLPFCRLAAAASQFPHMVFLNFPLGFV